VPKYTEMQEGIDLVDADGGEVITYRDIRPYILLCHSARADK
jgi:hypothetical protein